MKYLVDMHDNALYIGAEVIFTDGGCYLYKSRIKKFTEKSVIMENGFYIAKRYARHRIYIL